MSREFLAVNAGGSAAFSKNYRSAAECARAIRTRLYSRYGPIALLALLCTVTEAVHPSIAPSYVTT